MEVTFAKEYSAILKDLLHYLGLKKTAIKFIAIRTILKNFFVDYD